jgi:hypothetical protein
LIHLGAEVVAEKFLLGFCDVYQTIRIKNNLIHVGAEVVIEQFLLGS